MLLRSTGQYRLTSQLCLQTLQGTLTKCFQLYSRVCKPKNVGDGEVTADSDGVCLMSLAMYCSCCDCSQGTMWSGKQHATSRLLCAQHTTHEWNVCCPGAHDSAVPPCVHSAHMALIIKRIERTPRRTIPGQPLGIITIEDVIEELLVGGRLGGCRCVCSLRLSGEVS